MHVLMAHEQVAEGWDVLDKINEAFTDADGRPYQNIRYDTSALYGCRTALRPQCGFRTVCVLQAQLAVAAAGACRTIRGGCAGVSASVGALAKRLRDADPMPKQGLAPQDH